MILIPDYVADQMADEERTRQRAEWDRKKRAVIIEGMRNILAGCEEFEQHCCVHWTDGTLAEVLRDIQAYYDKPDSYTNGDLIQSIQRFIQRIG